MTVLSKLILTATLLPTTFAGRKSKSSSAYGFLPFGKGAFMAASSYSVVKANNAADF